MAVFNTENSHFVLLDFADELLISMQGFWLIDIKSYLCKNFGFQHIGMKRESGESPGLSPQL